MEEGYQYAWQYELAAKDVEIRELKEEIERLNRVIDSITKLDYAVERFSKRPQRHTVGYTIPGNEHETYRDEEYEGLHDAPEDC